MARKSRYESYYKKMEQMTGKKKVAPRSVRVKLQELKKQEKEE